MKTFIAGLRHSLLVRPMTTLYLVGVAVLVMVSQQLISLTTAIIADGFVAVFLVIIAVRADVARVHAEHVQLLVVLKDEGLADAIPLPDEALPERGTTP